MQTIVNFERAGGCECLEASFTAKHLPLFVMTVQMYAQRWLRRKALAADVADERSVVGMSNHNVFSQRFELNETFATDLAAVHGLPCVHHRMIAERRIVAKSLAT